ncbi:MAG: type IV pilus secretin PilQ [Myxococcales bacterium]|nr:type IV pilus secretin PilQ [Myxococcales bacterium]
MTAVLAALLTVGSAMAGEEVKDTISDVEVRQSHGTTQIVLRGAEEPIYTAFMREDPPGLVVELYDVTFEGMESPMLVSDGTVQEIAFGEYGDGAIGAVLGRMTVGLAHDSEYEVIPSGSDLVVKIWPRNWEAGSSSDPEDAPPAAPADSDGSEAFNPSRADEAPSGTSRAGSPVIENSPTLVAKAQMLEKDPASSDQLRRIDAKATRVREQAQASSRITNLRGFETRIVVQATGPIDNVDSFLLDSPERLVIDFWGAENGLDLPLYEVNQGAIRQLRVGTHPEKVRVVVDLRGPIASHVIEHSESGVQIELSLVGEQAESAPEPIESTDDGIAERPSVPSFVPAIERRSGDVIQIAANPVAASHAPYVARTPAPATSGHVSSVQFESIEGMDRIVVITTGGPQPILVHPDPVTAVLDFPHASIEPQAQRRLDTREFGGPVEQVSAFRTPDIEIEQARIVVKHRGTSRPSFEQRDGRWVLEFAHAGRPLAAAPADRPRAAVPPSYAAAPWMAEAHAAPVPGPAMNPSQAATFRSYEVDPSPVPSAPENPNPAAIDVLREGSYSTEKSYSGRRISLDFKDADIASILRLIAEVSDLNIVAGEEVSGKVTIRLVDVPWDQAMDVVLLTKGLGFTRVGNVLRIAPIDLLHQEEESRLAERRAKEKLEDLVVKFQPVNYADVDEIEGLVERLLTERGSVDVDRRTSTLIIKDIPSVIHESTALVKAIDTQTPQVLIEAKIVEADLNFSRSLGATWGLGYNPLGGWGGAPDFHLGDGTNPSSLGGMQETNFVVQNPVENAVGVLTAGLLGLADRLQLDLRLQAAETNGTGKVVSSPRVLTLDNTEATILQGVAIPFEATTENSINTNFVDAVLELKVTPHITADGSIVMKIKVSRNAPEVSSATNGEVGIRKNETQTEALVMDGQTMVLGGIYVVDKSDSSTGVPFLSKIPLLGAAFSSSTKVDKREELLIFVTPRIVHPRGGAS